MSLVWFTHLDKSQYLNATVSPSQLTLPVDAWYVLGSALGHFEGPVGV